MSLELRKEITLDIQNLQNTPQITIKSGNHLSNIILITLQNNGEEINLNGLKCRYCILRSDCTQNLSDAEIQDNKVKITLKENDLQSPGIVSCEIILSESEKVVFSSTFYIIILANVLDEQKVKNSDEYGSIINILDKTDGLADEIISLENRLSDNEDLRQTRENIRIENENVRQENELQRQNSFTQIENKSNEIIIESEQNSQYAKQQGDYAKAQADRIVDSDVSSLQNEIRQLNQEIDTLQTDNSNLQEEVDDLKGFVGYIDEDIYGVEVDFKNMIFTRLAGAKNLTDGADFDIINAYNRRRCILNDNGDVIAYYGDSGYIEDGSVGQVMVEQPKFYYKVVPLELEPITDGKGYHLRKARYYICDTPKYGFKLHPAFIKSGVEKDKIYLSAYEGSIYDTSANKYLLNDEQVADFNTDKLCSIINAKPSSGITQQLNRQNTRKLANNRGNGWGIFTIQSIAVTQILSLIEYASFNMQEKIGIGVTNKGSSTLNISENTGVTSVLGNKTGSKINQNGYNFISYRGEENIFSNQWGWVDGMNIYNYDIKPFYISDHNFEDNIGELPYKEVGFNLQGGEGYISAFGYCQDYDWLFIPTEFNGNSALPVGDYVPEMMNKNNWTGVAFGGSWGFGDKSGLYCYTFHSISKGSGARDVSNRLLYISPEQI